MASIVANDLSKPFDGIFAKMTELAAGNIVHLRQISISTSASSMKTFVAGLVDANATGYFQTRSKKGHYVDFDFKNRQIRPTGYTLQTGPLDANMGHLSCWQVQVSNDGTNYTNIDTKKKDLSLNSNLAFVTYPVTCPDFVKHIRIRMSGPNTAKNARMLLKRVEFFGELRGVPIECSPFGAYDAQSLESLRSSFIAADSDGNGTLDMVELVSFFTNTLHLDSKLVPLAFKVCDLDDNGLISFDEFVNFYHKLSPLTSANPLPAYRLLFESIDIENHGALDVHEVKLFCIYIGFETPDDYVQTIIAENDSDGDGRLTYDELLKGVFGITTTKTFYQPHSYSPEEKTQLRAQFTAIDTDGNGTLDFNELAIFCDRLVGDGGQDMAEMIMTVCDTDHNGVISFDEFVEFNQMVLAMQLNEMAVYHKIFDVLDEDRAESLDKLQLFRFYKYISAPMTAEEIQTRISAYDSDHDGRLTFDEAVINLVQSGSSSEAED